MIKHYNIRITGRVQGVGFRYNTKMKAHELKVYGFVKNLADRSVYIEAEGEDVALKEFLAWCKKGPSWSRVEKIDISESPFQNFTNFEIR